MPKFEITATHPVTFLFSIEAPNRDEAERIVMANEHSQDQAELIDEGQRTISSIKETPKSRWEK